MAEGDFPGVRAPSCADEESPAGVAGGLLDADAVALSLGFVISAVTKSQLVANEAAILMTYLPSLLLSDFVFPIANMPKILQAVTAIVPARYFIDILNGLYLRNLGFSYLWPSYAVLAVMALFLGTLAFLILKREGL